MSQFYSDPSREHEYGALPDCETFEVRTDGACAFCEAVERESRESFERAFEFNTKGLHAVSSGFLPQCAECRDAYGYRDVEDEDGNVTATAEERAQADWETGKLSDESSFSWQDCDTCGQSLGGDREFGHGLDDENRVVHLSMCIDCVVYVANGDVPESWPDGSGPEHTEHVGWYWQACFPGCLPDGDPVGPFATEDEAINDAREVNS